jgi:hypothetical protein
MRGLLCAVSLFAASLSAAAAAPRMQVASSAHFTIYSEQDEADLRRFAEELEVYDAVLRRMTGAPADDPDVQPVTIYVKSNQFEIGMGGNVLGFYLPTAAGPMTVVPRKLVGMQIDGLVRTILFHEYAHHFLMQRYPALYSPWFVEGVAEFYGATEIEPDAVLLGKPATLRVGTLKGRRHTTLKHLLNPGQRSLTAEQVDELYARGWLLVHYLTLSKERGGQIGDYLRERSKGRTEEEAFRLALHGTFEGIDQELKSYFRTRHLTYVGIARPAGARVTVRPATSGEAELTEVVPRLRQAQSIRDLMTGPGSSRGDRDRFDHFAARVADSAGGLARRFPDDAKVQEIAAEAHFLAGEPESALQTASRAVTLQPDNARAHLVLAEVTRKSVKTGDPAGIVAYRKKVVVANRAAPSDPLPLLAYYRTYADFGLKTPQIAFDALDRANQLAPQDETITLLLAAECASRKLYGRAAGLLRPIAFAPHGGPQKDAALKLLQTLPVEHESPLPTIGIESGPKPEGQSPS